MTAVETLTQVLPTGTLPLDVLKPHEMNLRRDLGDLTDLAASIKSLGVLAPVTVAPNGEAGRYVILAGHRRCAAAEKAGLTEVPVTVRADLDDEADQIAVMLTENSDRAGLTADEEAAGVDLMLDLGESVATISKRLGWSRTKVKSRAKIAKLDAATRAKIHGAQLSISDAEFIADHPDDADRLEDVIGTPDYAVVRERIRLREESAARVAAQIAEAKKAGVSELPCPQWGIDYEGRTHAVEESGRRVVKTDTVSWSLPALADVSMNFDADDARVYYCAPQHYHNGQTVMIVVYQLGEALPDETAAPDENDQDDPAAAEQVEAERAEWRAREEAERQAAAAAREERAAATTVRRDYMRRLTPGVEQLRAAAALLTQVARTNECAVVGDLAPECLPIDVDAEKAHEDPDVLETVLLDWIAAATPTAIAWAFVWSGLAIDVDDILSSIPRGWKVAYYAPLASDYVRLLEQCGHELSTIERATVDEWAKLAEGDSDE